MALDITLWHWLGLSLALFSLELLIGTPAVIFLWTGLAGLLISALLSIFNIPFAGQIVLFSVLSVVLTWAGRSLFKYRLAAKTNFLNQRGQNLQGFIVTLDQPIVDGHGRLPIGDSFWRVKGPDLPMGTKVKVVGVNGNTLIVLPVDKKV